MARYIWRTYECPGRKLKTGVVPPHPFEVMEDRDERAQFCTKCGRDLRRLPIDATPGTHSVGKSDINKAVDLTYRLVEESSAERAELAGNPSLKVNNMRDHLREGDVAVPMPNNTVTQFMGMAEQRGIGYGFGGGMMAPAFSSGQAMPVSVDPVTGYTGPTHAALSAAQGESGHTHLATRREMITAGTINKTKGNSA